MIPCTWCGNPAVMRDPDTLLSVCLACLLRLESEINPIREAPKWPTSVHEKDKVGVMIINGFPVVTICGSMRYYQRMLQVAEEYTNYRYIVLMPFVARYQGGIVTDDDKAMLDRMHRVKIDLSEAIVVVGVHIGDSTRSEIEYAKATGKRISYITEGTDGQGMA